MTDGVGGKKIDLILDFRPQPKMLWKNGRFQGFVLLLLGSVEAPLGPRWAIWDP